jgi:hypothetical protein
MMMYGSTAVVGIFCVGILNFSLWFRSHIGVVVEAWIPAHSQNHHQYQYRHESQRRKRSPLHMSSSSSISTAIGGDFDHWPNDNDNQNQDDHQESMMSSNPTHMTTSTTTTTTSDKLIANSGNHGSSDHSSIDMSTSDLRRISSETDLRRIEHEIEEIAASTTATSAAAINHAHGHDDSDDDDDDGPDFVASDELHMLRRKVLNLRRELHEARKLGHTQQAQKIEQSILAIQSVDAEFVYALNLERYTTATLHGQKDEAKGYRSLALQARAALPQFNLEGLWVGKYGDQGFEMINVTYTGDVLTAYKVTGDRNVPRGEISFQVDLSPKNLMFPGSRAHHPKHGTNDSNLLDAPRKAPTKILEPIELDDDSAAQWGTRFLTRFAGQGQVASPNFANSQFVDGQLILVGRYFSFAWLPIGHQVFFGRPGAELTLKLLRETNERHKSSQSSPASILLTSDQHDRAFLNRCIEETELLDDEMEINSDGLFASHEQQDYFQQVGCFE